MRGCFFAIILLLLPSMLHAAAWTQKKGKGQIILNYNFYRTKTQLDYDGDRESLNRYFSSHRFNPYIEYGLTDDTTIGLNAFIERAEFHSPDAQFDGVTYGINDTEVFLRHRLWHGPTYAISAQGTVIVPGFHDEDRQPSLGPNRYGLEARILAGMNIHLLSPSDFINAEFGYRYRSGTPSDELRADFGDGRLYG
jgi:hypothetical protein